MNEKEKKTFGDRVREVRDRLNLTQEKMGKGLKITLQYLSEIELDKKRPGYDFFDRMVTVFKVNLNYLFLGEGEMFLGEVEKEGVLPKRIKTGYLDVDEFWNHFFRSDTVRYNALLEYSKLKNKERGLNNNMTSPGNQPVEVKIQGNKRKRIK